VEAVLQQAHTQQVHLFTETLEVVGTMVQPLMMKQTAVAAAAPQQLDQTQQRGVQALAELVLHQ
jgi:hypothetical protein